MSDMEGYSFSGDHENGINILKKVNEQTYVN